MEATMAEKIIALTFDDGPNTTTTVQVLEKLAKHGVTASFFVVGNNITEDSAPVMKRAFDMGCEVHNHSRSHSAMPELSAEEIAAEVDYTDAEVYEVTGQHTRLFRPPYIAVNDVMFDTVDMPFIAGIGCEDWMPEVTAQMRAEKILAQAKDGDIILLHDAAGNIQTVEALDIIIPELKERGFRFVTATELFREKDVPMTAAARKVYTNVLQTEVWA